MKWISHIAIGGSIAAVWRPELVPLAIMGSTAPDWMEWVSERAFRRRIKHRTVTHYLFGWLIALAFGLAIWDFHHAITAFALGGLSHVICDSLTVQGVPLGWWSDRRFHLLGGRMKTGHGGEYWVVAVVVIMCALVGFMMRSGGHGGEFSPFFWDWSSYYKSGEIDAAEWKENRFKWL